jgi:hypothetical protein
MLVAGLLWPISPARATEEGETSVDTPSGTATVKAERTWYGWQVAAAGGTGAVILSIGMFTHDAAGTMQKADNLFFFPVGLATYLLGGPIIHWSNDNLGRGALSFGLNVAVPLTVGFTGGAVACSREAAGSQCRANGFFDWGAVAVLLVPLVDAALLGWREDELERTITTSGAAWTGVRPWLGLGAGKPAMIGVAGGF